MEKEEKEEKEQRHKQTRGDVAQQPNTQANAVREAFLTTPQRRFRCEKHLHTALETGVRQEQQARKQPPPHLSERPST